MTAAPGADAWISVAHEAPSAVEGAISVVPVGYEPVDGYVYIERDDQMARVVLHENVGLHLEKAGIDVHDPALPDRVETALGRVFKGGWSASVTWSALEDGFFPDVQIHVSPAVPLAADRSDLEVAQALLPAVEALYAVVEPGHPLYVFDRVAEQQASSATVPVGGAWETVAAPPQQRQLPPSQLSSPSPARPPGL